MMTYRRCSFAKTASPNGTKLMSNTREPITVIIGSHVRRDAPDDLNNLSIISRTNNTQGPMNSQTHMTPAGGRRLTTQHAKIRFVLHKSFVHRTVTCIFCYFSPGILINKLMCTNYANRVRAQGGYKIRSQAEMAGQRQKKAA